MHFSVLYGTFVTFCKFTTALVSRTPQNSAPVRIGNSCSVKSKEGFDKHQLAGIWVFKVGVPEQNNCDYGVTLMEADSDEVTPGISFSRIPMICCLKLACYPNERIGICRDTEKRRDYDVGAWKMNHGEIKYCPGTGNVGCWVSTATESSNQSPSIDFQTSPVNSPDQNKPIDLGASSSYSNSDDNPLARLISSLDQPIPSVGVDTTTPNYASPPIEKFEVPTGDEEGLQFPEAASKFPNLFVDPIL